MNSARTRRTLLLPSLLTMLLFLLFSPGSLAAPATLAGSAEGVEVTRPEDVGMSSERLARIASGMKRLIDEQKIPGAVTLVARRGQVVHFEAIGQRDINSGLPMERNTIFRLYSQSKPVTGVAVMILFEEGHFLLSDPVSKYLPEFESLMVATRTGPDSVDIDPAARPMTIHHLLTHTSGLTYEFLPSVVAQAYQKAGITGASPGTQFESLEEWSQTLAQQPLLAHPGTAWNYSVGMDVLGRLVEVVSGQKFGEFLRQRIFDPLGMTDTGFWVAEDKAERFAANYTPKPGGGLQMIDNPKASPYLKPPVLEMGGSGLVGTVGDYLRFAQMLLNGGELDGHRILGRKTVDLMMQNHLGPEFPPRSPDQLVRSDSGQP